MQVLWGRLSPPPPLIDRNDMVDEKVGPRPISGA